MIEVLNDSVEWSRNKKGEWEAERRSFHLTNAELKKNADNLGIDNKALKQRVGSLKNLVSSLQGDILASGSGEIQLMRSDTIYSSDSTKYFIGHGFDWTNDYLTLNGTLDNTYKLKFDYTYSVAFTTDTFWKRERNTNKNGKKKLFKEKNLTVNFTLDDPNAKAIGLNSVVIRPDPPKFYQTTWFKIGVGFLGGVFIAK